MQKIHCSVAFEVIKVCVRSVSLLLLTTMLNVGHAQDLVINELMASNDLAHPDAFFEFNDWMEIYNPGGLVQLAGYHLSDDPTNLTKYTIPNTDEGSTFLPPNDHLVVWLDQDSAQGVLHANFKLSAEDEGIWLTAPDGVTVLDSIVYPPQQTDISYGRSCDGCDDWAFFNVPTPDAPNTQSIVPTPLLYINEVLLENTGVLVDEQFEFEPWLEVHNPNDFQVNLAGYTVVSSEGGSAIIPNDAPVETTVEANGFLLLWMDGEPNQGANHLDLTSSIQSQTFTLIGPDMMVADEYEAQVSFANVSWGRVIDGSATSTYFDIPTPRVTNALLVIPAEAVVINECLTSNQSGLVDDAGELEDWIELHNRTENAINLAGYYLSDRLNNPQRWRIPTDAGDVTVIEPGGYMVIWADDDEVQGWNHTNFKLSSNGESLVLRSPDGFTIADSVHFGGSEPDDSFARIPDGTGPFEWTSDVTPGDCNDCPDAVFETNRTRNALYFGPNPLKSGQRVMLSKGAELMDCQGDLVATFKGGMSTMPVCAPGVYILHGNGGEVVRLVVSGN